MLFNTYKKGYLPYIKVILRAVLHSSTAWAEMLAWDSFTSLQYIHFEYGNIKALKLYPHMQRLKKIETLGRSVPLPLPCYLPQYFILTKPSTCSASPLVCTMTLLHFIKSTLYSLSFKLSVIISSFFVSAQTKSSTKLFLHIFFNCVLGWYGLAHD
jgi:hypothetical protein